MGFSIVKGSGGEGDNTVDPKIDLLILSDLKSQEGKQTEPFACLIANPLASF